MERKYQTALSEGEFQNKLNNFLESDNYVQGHLKNNTTFLLFKKHSFIVMNYSANEIACLKGKIIIDNQSITVLLDFKELLGFKILRIVYLLVGIFELFLFFSKANSQDLILSSGFCCLFGIMTIYIVCVKQKLEKHFVTKLELSEL